MFKKILLFLVLIIIGFCGYVATLPSEYRYESARTIPAPADAIFAHVNNQSDWPTWSPWGKEDPDAKFSFEGPDSGVGSIAKWDGNMEVGKGSSTITKSAQNKEIIFKMEFLEPMEDTSEASFTFEPADGGTRVTWAMYGKADFLGKAIGVIMDCETMVEEKFAEGLENLEALVVSEAPAAAEAEEAATDEAAEETPTEEAAE